MTGVDVMLGTGRTALAAALAALSDSHDWQTHPYPKRPFYIAVNRVLSEAWNADRLERATRLLAEGQTPLPISVVRFRLRDQTWYSVSDGNHRTEAARAAGRPTIRAKIAGTYVVPIGHYVLRREFEGERLWRFIDDSPRDRARLAADLADDVAATLESLGVRRVAAWDENYRYEPLNSAT